MSSQLQEHNEVGKNKCSEISIAVLDDGWLVLNGWKENRKKKVKEMSNS